MRCLLTGATGVLGAQLLRLLLDRGATVATLVRPNSDTWRIRDVVPHTTQIAGSLSDIQAVASEIQAFRPEVVFHLGWQGVSNRLRNDPSQVFANVCGSLDLVRAAGTAGCRRWVGLGSQAELGPHEGALTADLPARPVTAYGAAKLSVGLLAEHLCKSYAMERIWLRLLAIYGPRDDATHLIPHVILELLQKRRPALTDGQQVWDYLYVADAAEALWRAAVQPNVHGTFMLGSGRAHSVREIVESIRGLVDPDLPLGFGELPYREDQPSGLEADIWPFRDASGWEPSTSLQDGLAQTVAWYRDNMERYVVET